MSAAETESIDLGDFEGKSVLVTSVAVTNAGDGLSAALGVDPQILHQGDRGAILLEYEVAKVRFEPVKDTNGLNRVHILKAHTGTLLDLDEVQDRLEAQRRRIDEAEGQLTLDTDGHETGGGEPQPIGAVLDDALAMAEDAASDGDWREQRAAELEPMSRDELVAIAEKLGIQTAKLTKAELRDEIVAWEAEERGGDE